MAEKQHYTDDELGNMRGLLLEKLTRELDPNQTKRLPYTNLEIYKLLESRLQSCILGGITYKELYKHYEKNYPILFKENPLLEDHTLIN